MPRRGAELTELGQGVAELEARETEHDRLEETMARLATFPEQNPNPVIETDLEGQVTYLNPVAKERFPDLHTAGLQHPILEGLESIIHTLKEGKETLSCASSKLAITSINKRPPIWHKTISCASTPTISPNSSGQRRRWRRLATFPRAESQSRH